MEITVYLDPQAAFMMHRLDMKSTKQVDGIKPGGSVEAKGYQEYKDGVFLPTELQMEEYHEDVASSFRVRLKCKFISVNQHLNARALEIGFPEGLHCIDENTGQVLIWGKEDAERQFLSHQDYRDWLKEARAATQPSFPTKTVLFVGLNVLVLAFAFWVFNAGLKQSI